MTARDAATHSIRWLVATALAGVLLALVLVQAAPAAAAVTITKPLGGTVTNERQPQFVGSAEQLGGPVTLDIYEGPLATGVPMPARSTTIIEAGTWSLEPLEPLADGTYTAEAVQGAATSLPVTFTVLTAAPVVTIDQPDPAAGEFTPSFSGTASDTTPVTVQISAAETVVATATAAAAGAGAAWHSSPASPALAAGSYTAVAVQRSSVTGNPTGRSDTVAFEVAPAPPPPSPPVSPAPAAGVSAELQAAPPAQRALLLLSPFPVVRVAGVAFAHGIKLRLLSVQQAPAGALVRVRCRGRGCPPHGASRTTVAGPHGVPAIVFRSFDRFLRPGAVIEVFVTKAGALGKYTRLRVRRGRVPERVDLCLDATGVTPIACPSQ